MCHQKQISVRIAELKVCVLAVNSGLWFWLKTLLQGQFSAPPALRLHGTVSIPRKGTPEELALWARRVRRVRRTKGYALMWASMTTVRDIHFSKAEEVHIGAMTRGAWSEFTRWENHTAYPMRGCGKK